MQCVIVIPARMGSSRFPGKPLCDLLGRPMIQWVVDAALASGVASRVIVATPDPEIVDACGRFGAEAMLTRHDHETGTDRLAEVASAVKADVYVNVQGDEPLMRPASIAACADPLVSDHGIAVASVFCDCPPEDEQNPAAVKVVLDKNGFALYFSRYAVPFPRNPRRAPLYKHIGLYAFTHEALAQFAAWPPSSLEQTESLEQLRFLENGVRIKMSYGAGSELAVDTPEQADEVRAILSARRS